MSNYYEVLRTLNEAKDQLDEIISSHECIQSDDDQYDDPELWWARPTRDFLIKTITALEDNS